MQCSAPQKSYASFLDACAEVLGPSKLIIDADERAQFETDWLGQNRASALAVAFPQSTAEVAQVVTLCAREGIAVVPQGGQTGLAAGAVPTSDRPSLILSLSRMSRIRSIDAQGRVAIAEAGVVLETLQNAVGEHDLVFPLMFGARGSCMIGGALSTNAGGSNVLRYGSARALCLGIEAVLPDGSVIDSLHGLRKDNTGYDLRDLLIGAEGTLGIITAATLQLFAQPVAQATAFVSLRSLHDAPALLNILQDRTGGAVEAFEYMPQPVVDAICNAFPQTQPPLTGPVETGLLIEVASTRPIDAEIVEEGTPRLNAELLAVLVAQMESGHVLDAIVATSQRQRDALWAMREAVLESITHAGQAYHFDLALPLQSVASFVADMDAEIADFGFRTLTIGHLGDGNLHYALAAPAGVDFDSLPLAAARSAVLDRLAAMGGSFSAEHGIGQSKLDLMRQQKQPNQLTAMQAIKRAFDPKNIMNPGKLVPMDPQTNLKNGIAT